MANLTETNQWVEGIYEFALDDWVEGGPDGVDNLPHKQLANRTQFLKGKVEELRTDVDGIIAASGDLGTHKTQVVIDHPDYSVTSIKMADGAAIDRVIGNRTISDITIATAGADSLTGLFGKAGYMLKQITGQSNWYTLPKKNINQLDNEKLAISGGIMTGPLELSADPVGDMEAATKRYVKNNGGLNNWRAGISVAVGDICYSKNTPSYVRMECVVGGITGDTEPQWTGVGTYVADGWATWIVDDIRDGMLPGDICPPSMIVRPGRIKIVGQLVERVNVPRLVKLATDNNLFVSEENWAGGMNGLFGMGDGATTIRMPDLRAEFIRVLDDGRGIDTDRPLGGKQLDQIQQHYHYSSSSGWVSNGGNTYGGAGVGSAGGSSIYVQGARVGTETRGRNIAYYATMKY